MVPAAVALALLCAFALLGVAAWMLTDTLEVRRRQQWAAECREFGCHEPPYDWDKEGSA